MLGPGEEVEDETPRLGRGAGLEAEARPSRIGLRDVEEAERGAGDGEPVAARDW